MKCPACGYVSFDRLEACKRCGAPMAATAGGRPAPRHAEPAATVHPADPDDGLRDLRLEPGPLEPAPPAGERRPRRRTRAKAADQGANPVEMLDDDALEVSEEDLAPLPAAAAGHRGPDDGGMPFHIDDDLFADLPPAEAPVGEAAAGHEWTDQGHFWRPAAEDLSEPAFVLDDEAAGEADGAPVIDRDEEVPDRFWAPEIAGLGRRAAALVVDQTLLASLLGLFFLGAYLALRLSGFDTDLFLAAAGLQAALPPFALLAAVLSLAYHSFFHGYTGRTPGKALAGIEVTTSEGAAPSWGRVMLRWFCAALALAGAGVGVAWALFEPRRRGWADLLSGTVVARQRREPAGAHERR